MITKQVQAMKKYTESSITHIFQATVFINPLAYVNSQFLVDVHYTAAKVDYTFK